MQRSFLYEVQEHSCVDVDDRVWPCAIMKQNKLVLSAGPFLLSSLVDLILLGQINISINCMGLKL